jgi:hypothetical protein
MSQAYVASATSAPTSASASSEPSNVPRKFPKPQLGRRHRPAVEACHDRAMGRAGVVGHEAVEDPRLRRDQPIPVRYRTTPPSDHPRGIWIAPIRTVFRDVLERWADHFNEATFSVELEPGVVWRSATDEDRSRLADWFDFYQEAHAPNEAQSVIEGQIAC